MFAMRLQKPGGLEHLRRFEVQSQAPGPGEIQVRIEASSLNYHDYAVASGQIEVEDGRVPLSDAAGTVTAIGEGVTEYEVGDAVLSCACPNWLDGEPTEQKLAGIVGEQVDGFAAQTVTRPYHSFTRAPIGYSAIQSATLPTAATTAWRGLIDQAGVQPGDVVLTQGTGGVSVFAVQFAKMAGCRVIATSSSDQKLEKLRLLGADEVINYRSTPDWGTHAFELTDGQGVDVVMEVGGAGTLPQSIRAIGIGGRISLIGVLAGYSGEISTVELLAKSAVLRGIAVGSRQNQLDMIRAIENCQIEPVTDAQYGLEDLADAFRYQESQQHFGKICINVS